MRGDRRRWLVVGGLVVLVAVAWLRSRVPPDPDEPVHAEGYACLDAFSAPAQASSEGRVQESLVVVSGDPRCDLAARSVWIVGDVIVPTHGESEEEVGAMILRAELRFDADDRCFYAVGDDGEPVTVIWPDRFGGDADPPRLVTADRRTVVSAGDRFEARGRFASGLGHSCGPAGTDSIGFIAGGRVQIVGP